jgi:energy-coupling factor transporter ATP-binding protein EcfA2
MRILDRINRTGTTVVMATHDHAIVDAMRRRVVEIDRGRITRDESRGIYETSVQPTVPVTTEVTTIVEDVSEDTAQTPAAADDSLMDQESLDSVETPDGVDSLETPGVPEDSDAETEQDSDQERADT